MGIRDQILAAHPDAISAQYNYSNIYIADFADRTASARSVEVSDAPQVCPISGGPMDSAVFHNPTTMSVEFVQYDDHRYIDLTGKIVKHCEGTLFPANEADVKWTAMLELKDCLPQNILNHVFKARRQIFNVTKDLRDRHILSSQKVFGVFSCPREHTAYNDTVFGDVIQQTRLKRYTGIIYVGTNEVMLIDKNTCIPMGI